ncbi:MAG TPA: RING finger protein [Planctomycetota bacterium]|nr:RING finger protein [Planctomycetota bacterium]
MDLPEIERVLVKRLGFRRETRRRATFPRFADLRYTGKLPSGRRGRVSFAGLGVRTRAIVAVAADDAARFRIERRGLLDWISRTLHAAPALERRLRVAAGARERARLAERALRGELVALFDGEQALALDLARGELAVHVPFLALPDGEAYSALLRQLERVARHFDREPLVVKLHGCERRALSGPRCAYCHDGLSGEELDLVACERCATVLHRSCWHLNERCPILGCDGVHPVGGAR